MDLTVDEMCQNACQSEQWTPAMSGHLCLDTGVSAEGGDYCIGITLLLWRDICSHAQLFCHMQFSPNNCFCRKVKLAPEGQHTHIYFELG